MEEMEFPDGVFGGGDAGEAAPFLTYELRHFSPEQLSHKIKKGFPRWERKSGWALLLRPHSRCSTLLFLCGKFHVNLHPQTKTHTVKILERDYVT